MKKKYTNAIIIFGFLVMLAFYIGFRIGKNAGRKQHLLEIRK